MSHPLIIINLLRNRTLMHIIWFLMHLRCNIFFIIKFRLILELSLLIITLRFWKCHLCRNYLMKKHYIFIHCLIYHFVHVFVDIPLYHMMTWNFLCSGWFIWIKRHYLSSWFYVVAGLVRNIWWKKHYISISSASSNLWSFIWSCVMINVCHLHKFLMKVKRCCGICLKKIKHWCIN